MVIKDFINDFVDAWKQYDKSIGRTELIDWHSRFKDAGYHPVGLTSLSEWQDIHSWCKRYVGEQHYTWTGQVFWFETEEAANWFKLRWL